MPRKPSVIVAALVVNLGPSSIASAQTGTEAPGGVEVTIDVDATAAGNPLEPIWAFHGYDEVNYTTTPEGRTLLSTLSASQAGPVRVRSHFLFNTGDGSPALKWGSTNLYTEDALGNPVYSFTLIDQIMDATLEAGTFPFFEIGFMPQALSTQPIPYENSSPYLLDGGSFYPPEDYEKWGALVTAWATHAKGRYPESLSSWLWELWNEPDIGYFHGTFEEYTRLYDYTEAALHGVLPEAPLGGPAVARADTDFLRDFLAHCAAGTNAVTGQTGTRLDMVSFHAKGGVIRTEEYVQMDLGNQLRLHRAGFDVVAASGTFAGTPIVISEADPDGCAACPVSSAPQHAYRNSPAYGAYEVAMMKRSLDLAAQSGVNLRGILTWAFTFPGTPYFAGYRALSTNGIHLPVLNAFKLLGQLRGDRLPVTSSGALGLSELVENGVRAQPDIDALAAIDDDQIGILVWNYHDHLVGVEPAHVTLDIALPASFADGAVVTHRRVDESHGNAFAVWESQGSPAAPSDEQLAALRDAMQPVTLESEQELDSDGGAVSLSFELPRFGLSLFTLVPSNGNRPGASPANAAACSCRAGSATPRPPLLFFSLLFATVLTRRRFASTRPARVCA